MLSTRRIIRTWWPLAASWLLMGAELPALSAVVARLPQPEINLAAYGGIVFPLALIIESPIIMLLAASTALSKDWDSYRKIYRFMMVTSAATTAIHALIAFTPLYDIIVVRLLGVPQAIQEPGRIGLMIMLPWTWSIAYRRFHQGVLIRFDHSRAVGFGTFIRLSADLLVLLVGFSLGKVPGIVVATAAVAAGVVCEAVYIGIVVQPVLRNDLRKAPPVITPLTLRSFLDFYIPLAMTSLIGLLVQPIGSAALSRMPLAVASLAAWPVINGLSFMFRSLGIAYNEVVVALLDEPQSFASLQRFTRYLAGLTTLLLFVITATPLSRLWFEGFSGLSTQLTELATTGLWLLLPTPALAVYQSWYQGSILHGRKTRGITESVVIFLVTSAVLLLIGVTLGQVTGLYIGLGVLTLAMAAQTLWLWRASGTVFHKILARDTTPVA